MKRKAKTMALALAAIAVLGAIGAAGAQGRFTSTENVKPLFLLAKNTKSFVFTFGAGASLECSTATLEGSQSVEEVAEITLTPVLQNCKMLGFTTDFKVNSCDFLFTTPATDLGSGLLTGPPPHIRCKTAFEVTPTFLGASVCTVTVGEQTPAGGHVIYANAGGPGSTMDYDMELTIEGISYTTHGGGGVCPTSGTNGAISSSFTMRGFSDSGHTIQRGATVDVD